MTMAAPPLLSVTWFPLHERTTATAIAAGAGYVGTGLGFIAGKLGNSLVDYNT